mgnify:CR=1 FL=1
MKNTLFMFIILLSCLTCSKSNNAIDVCRCLIEPGNSSWMEKNENECRDAISNAIGVPNWEKVNFSRNPDLSAKWDRFVNDCDY